MNACFELKPKSKYFLKPNLKKHLIKFGYLNIKHKFVIPNQIIMSFKAKFKAGGIEANVLSSSYSLNQEVDATGRPSSITRGGTIALTVEGTGSTELYEWMCNSFEQKEGSVIFFKRDSDATLKELKFKDGYIINFYEHFNATGGDPLWIGFTISAREMTMGSATHINEWV